MVIRLKNLDEFGTQVSKFKFVCFAFLVFPKFFPCLIISNMKYFLFLFSHIFGYQQY